MAYDTYELSEYLGAPVELFLFKDDIAQQTWAFTTGDDALIDGLITFVPGIINRTSVKAGGNEITSGVQIKVPIDSNLAQQFKSYLPSRPIGLVVQRYHHVDGAAERKTSFTGEVSTVAFENDGMATLSCEPITKAVKRKVPWQVYKGGCNRALYEVGCGVSRAAFATPAGTYTISGNTVTSTAFGAKPDGWFNNGYLEVPATGDRRYIIAHVGNTITLDYPLFGLAAGEPLTAQAGCPRTRAVCRDRFNNLPNYLGWDWIPQENPFDTNFGPSQAGGGVKGIADIIFKGLVPGYKQGN